MRVILLLIVVCWAPVVWAAPKPEKVERQYVLFPVTTELHKQELLSPNDRYYLVVYGSGIVDKDGRIIPQRLDFDEMAKDFGQTIYPGDRMDFVVLYERDDQKIGRTVGLALKGFAAEMGFPAKTDSSSIHPGQWDRLMRITKNNRGVIDASGEEKPIGDGPIRSYPVRTALSRFLADADCFVSITEPLNEKFDGSLPKQWIDEIERSVARLGLDAKSSVTFSIRIKGADLDSVRKFHRTQAKELAEKLGFKEYSVRMGSAH